MPKWNWKVVGIGGDHAPTAKARSVAREGGCGRCHLPGVRTQFEDTKGKPLRSWSGKSIREMAVEVSHEEAYDVFYADLSSFTHTSVNLANRFLRLKPGEISWTQRAHEFDIASAFRYGAIFLTCLLEHFGAEFGAWTAQEVRNCWHFPEAVGRKPQP